MLADRLRSNKSSRVVDPSRSESTRLSDSRCAVVRFCYHSYDYRPNWTPLSPITITYVTCEIQQKCNKIGKQGLFITLWRSGLCSELWINQMKEVTTFCKQKSVTSFWKQKSVKKKGPSGKDDQKQKNKRSVWLAGRLEYGVLPHCEEGVEPLTRGAVPFLYLMNLPRK